MSAVALLLAVLVGTPTNDGVDASTYFPSGTDVALADGGTNKSITADAGAVVWCDSDSFELSAAGSANQILQSNGTSAPSWTSGPTLSSETTIAEGLVCTGDHDTACSGPSTRLDFEGVTACPYTTDTAPVGISIHPPDNYGAGTQTTASVIIRGTIDEKQIAIDAFASCTSGDTITASIALGEAAAASCTCTYGSAGSGGAGTWCGGACGSDDATALSLAACLDSCVGIDSTSTTDPATLQVDPTEGRVRRIVLSESDGACSTVANGTDGGVVHVGTISGGGLWMLTDSGGSTMARFNDAGTTGSLVIGNSTFANTGISTGGTAISEQTNTTTISYVVQGVADAAAEVATFIGTNYSDAQSGNLSDLVCFATDADNSGSVRTKKMCVKRDGIERHVVDARTIADDATGANAALTLQPNSTYVEISCADAQGCDVTLSEAAAIEIGEHATICIVAQTAGATNFADTAGVTQLAGAFAANIDDCLTIRYGTSPAWREVARSAN